MNWKDGLTQTQACEMLMNNGRALELLGNIMSDTAEKDYLNAVDRNAYLRYVPSLHPSFSWELATPLILLNFIHDSDKVVTYEKKEVGSLIRFPSGTAGNAVGVALVDYLIQVPSMMELNNAQTVELEHLLNKAGETLGIPMPSILPPTSEQQELIIKELALSALQAKPKLYYQKYVDELKSRGTPTLITQQEFLLLIGKTLI